jgi:hypothetical protein
MTMTSAASVTVISLQVSYDVYCRLRSVITEPSRWLMDMMKRCHSTSETSHLHTGLHDVCFLIGKPVYSNPRIVPEKTPRFALWPLNADEPPPALRKGHHICSIVGRGEQIGFVIFTNNGTYIFMACSKYPPPPEVVIMGWVRPGSTYERQ